MAKEQYFKQPSVMTTQQHFSQVPKADIQISRFNMSHSHKTTFDAGYLVPIYVEEIVPGDSFNIGHTAFGRLATPLKPIMDNLFMDVQYFFVPTRLTWDNWQAFMGERRNPDDDPGMFTVPTLTNIPAGGFTENSLADYFGLPINVENIEGEISALPFRAYNLIYNEWYRDQNLQDRVPENYGDGPDDYNADYTLLRRGKRHDYFTSCLPWPQKGEPVEIPIGEQAPVYGIGFGTIADNPATPGTSDYFFDRNLGPAQQDENTFSNIAVRMASADPGAEMDIYADLAQATSISINELRTAFQIQKMLERDARGGTRYIELILSHFAVVSPDARLQRPEFLGGSSNRAQINPVAQTSGQFASSESPQGNLAATGTSVSKGGCSKAFTEHGYIIGIMSVRADLTYQRGIDRMWSRKTRYDYYWPTFAHLGEQAVLNQEIFAQGDANDQDVFGYQERYAEYRYKPSKITGLFRSEAAQSLDVWHLSQDFAALPTLSAEFIQEDPPIDRVIAVQSEPHFIVDIWFNISAKRPMPVYSIPGFIDHF